MKTFNCNRTTQSELNFSSISNNKQNHINHLNSKSLNALVEQKEQDEHHRANKQILNSNLKMSNNYEIVDYENPLVNYPRKLTIVPTVSYKYDANTMDVYYNRDSNVYIEKTNNAYEFHDLPQTIYIKQVPSIPNKSDTESQKSSFESTTLNMSGTLNSQSQTRFNTTKTMVVHEAPTPEQTTTPYELSSQSNLIDVQKSVNQSPITNLSKKVTKNNIHINSGSCCCTSCCGFLNACLQILSCLSSCCFQPCCNMAAVLGGIVAIGGLLVGVFLMAILGLIPIPNEITKNICNASLERHFYYNNLTNTTPRLFSSSTPMGKLKLNFTEMNINNITIVKNQEVIDEFSKQTLLGPMNRTNFQLAKKRLKLKINNQQKFRNKISTFMAMQYDVLLLPNTIKENIITLKSVAPSRNYLNTEMKINMNVRLYCNASANVIYFKTQQFSHIELTFNENEDKLEVKKWNYDSTTNILEIETSKSCVATHQYVLDIFINFKNYGNVIYDYGLKQVELYFFMTNGKNFDNPFPMMVDYFHSKLPIYSGPSIFNITLAKLRSTQSMIFNTEIVEKKEQNGLEFIYYKPTPYVPAQAISFIYGNLNCKDDYFLEGLALKLKICSTNPRDMFGESFDFIANQVESLMDFYLNFTHKPYTLEKLDVVLLPKLTFDELMNNQIIMNHVGIIYLPSSYIKFMNQNDYMTKIQNKLKIINMISKQLAKHWFQNHLDLDCEKNIFKENYLNGDLTADTLNLINIFCTDNNCNQSMEKNFNAYLEYSEKCFIEKGIISWISYLGLQAIQTDIFGLPHLEWSLIKDFEEDNFLLNVNADDLYKAYNFPRLTESYNFQKIKTELRSLMAARTFYLIFGKDKFQSIIKDWFKIVLMSEMRINYSQKNQTNSQSLQVEAYLISEQAKKVNPSVLDIVERYSNQYNVIPYDNVSIKSIIRSWITAEKDIILNMNRNYNSKEATVSIDSSLSNDNQNNSLIKFYYPLCLFVGDRKNNFDEKAMFSDLEKNQIENIKWINKDIDTFRNLPGADKWVIANHMSMFAYFRINYDKQNWLTLTEQLLLNHKKFKIDERVQIIDDVFYLVNKQKLPISYALNMLEYIPNEESFLPWNYALKNVRKFLELIEDDSQEYLKFREYLIRLIKSTYHRLKWGESSLDTVDEKLIRVLVVDLLCSLDYEDCVENSVKQLTDSIKINVYNIPKYLSKSIYCTAIKYTGINEWFFLWKYYLQQIETNSDLKESILYSLSCTSQNWILNLLIRKLVDENSISHTDLPIAFEYISHNTIGKYVVWNHISQSYQTFFDRIGNDPDLFFKILQVITKEFKYKYEIKQVSDFIEEMGLKNVSIYYKGNNKKRIFSSIDLKTLNYGKWKQSNLAEFSKWLDKKLAIENF